MHRGPTAGAGDSELPLQNPRLLRPVLHQEDAADVTRLPTYDCIMCTIRDIYIYPPQQQCHLQPSPGIFIAGLGPAVQQSGPSTHSGVQHLHPAEALSHLSIVLNKNLEGLKGAVLPSSQRHTLCGHWADVEAGVKGCGGSRAAAGRTAGQQDTTAVSFLQQRPTGLVVAPHSKLHAGLWQGLASRTAYCFPVSRYSLGLPYICSQTPPRRACCLQSSANPVPQSLWLHSPSPKRVLTPLAQPVSTIAHLQSVTIIV